MAPAVGLSRARASRFRRNTLRRICFATERVMKVDSYDRLVDFFSRLNNDPKNKACFTLLSPVLWKGVRTGTTVESRADKVTCVLRARTFTLRPPSDFVRAIRSVRSKNEGTRQTTRTHTSAPPSCRLSP